MSTDANGKHVHDDSCAMPEEEAHAYVDAARQCFATLQGGPERWARIPDAMIRPEHADIYEVQAIASPAFYGQNYVEILRRFGHDAVDKLANSLEVWAGDEGNRPDLLATTAERLAAVRATPDA